jgi:protein O-mannosyl-transferase
LTMITKTHLLRSNTLLPFLLMGILGLLIYANSVNGDFIWDDEALVRDNISIRSVNNIPDIFTNYMGDTQSLGALGYYRPLTILTYAVAYALGGLDVRIYHYSSIFWHILASFSAYLLVSLLVKNRVAAFLAGLLFVAHPVHTATVSYISNLAESLSAFFIMTSFSCYVLHAESKNVRLFVLLLVCYACALLSKENSLLFPLLLLLYHYAFKKKLERKSFFSVLGLVFLYVFSRYAILNLPLSSPAMLQDWKHAAQRIPGFFVAILQYIRLLFFPVDLHMDYGARLFPVTDYRVLAGVAVTAWLAAYAFLQKNKNALLFFSVGWFFIALLSTSNVYPANAYYMAEHWIYLPALGFFIIVSKGLVDLAAAEKTKAFRLFSAVIISAYSCLSILQNNYWREPVSFYLRTLRFTPFDARLYDNLGRVYYGQGDYRKAIALYERAIELDPLNCNVYNNLGLAYADLGDHDKAIALYEKAIKLNPEFALAYNNLGISYNESGRSSEAVACFKKAIAISPRFGGAYCNLGLQYFYEKQYALAIQYFDRAASLGSEVPPDFLRFLKSYRK